MNGGVAPFRNKEPQRQKVLREGAKSLDLALAARHSAQIGSEVQLPESR